MTRWRTRPIRPHDVDCAQFETQGSFVIYSSRPSFVQGPKNCCHPNDLEISFLERGRTYADVGGRDIVLHPKQYSVISAGIEHCSHTLEEGSAGLYLHISQALFRRCAEELSVAPIGNQYTEPDAIPESLRTTAQALKAEVLSTHCAGSMLDALTYYLVGQLLRGQPARRRPATAADATSAQGLAARLARSVDRMKAEPGAPLSLDALAETAGLSKFRYAHAFRAQYGVSPHRFLVSQRLEAACKRLAASDEPITRIAIDLGFSSSSHLSATFRKAFGTTPSQWRQQHFDSRHAKS